LSPTPFTKLGFNFYGYGNVGDDMMLAGFLKVWPESRPLFSVVSRSQCSILSRRFPNVKWIAEGGAEPEYDLWLGVGDTPIQVLSGLFFLEYLEVELERARSNGAKVVFLGVGAEREALRERARFSKVLENVDLLLTRDAATHQILVHDFAIEPSSVYLGGDLAHIYLQEIIGPQWGLADRPLEIAVNYYAERKRRRSSLVALRWLQEQQSMAKTVAFLSNEARLLDGLEARHYAELAWVTCLNSRREAVALLSPNRWAASLDDMVAHFATIQTVMSSRYHCLLLAAWSGCRTYGLGRSSKIESLCGDIDIEFTSERALSNDALDRGMERAKRVPLSLLNSKADRSREAVRRALAQVGAGHGLQHVPTR